MTRTLPSNPSLEHLKKEAKSLHKAHGQGDAGACSVLRHLRAFADASDEDVLAAKVSLTDVQYALAMDYGFVSWQALRDSVRDASAKIGGDAATRKLVVDLLTATVASGATDIHIEPEENRYRVRVRKDGVLHEADESSVDSGVAMARELKRMAGLDPDVVGVPQYGRIRLTTDDAPVDLRISVLRVLFGEKTVLRVVDPTTVMGLDEIGFEDQQETLVAEALGKAHGVVLVAGPAGSGKSATLYTALGRLNSESLSIATVEESVEIRLAGVSQCPVSPTQGLDYPDALRSIMTLDPDVVMIGEIRDLETANMAFKAAQTGHLVLAGMVADSAPEALERLKDLGVQLFMLATSIDLVIAQRLLRKLCTDCRSAMEVPTPALLAAGFAAEEAAPGTSLHAAKGCDACGNGYKGRAGIFQVVKVTPAISALLAEGAEASQIAKACEREGFADLVQAGLAKAKAGVTSLHEVQRVLTGL